MKGLTKLVVVLLVLVLVGAVAYLAYDFVTGKKDEEDLSQLAQQVASALEKQGAEAGEVMPAEQPRVVAKLERLYPEEPTPQPAATQPPTPGPSQEAQPAPTPSQVGQPSAQAAQGKEVVAQPTDQATPAPDAVQATPPPPEEPTVTTDQLIGILEQLIGQDSAFANPAIEVLRLKIDPTTEAGAYPKVSAQVRGEFLRSDPDLTWLETELSAQLGELGYRDAQIQVLDLKVNIQLVVLPQYKELYQQNKDMIGWIQIDKTQVNYPVMQTPADPEYYLRTNFKGEYAYSGLPFLDARNDPNERTQNLVVYAHNMKSGAMFGTIPNYESPSYWRSHPIIKFDVLTEEREYEVFGAFYSRQYKEGEEGFRYADYIDLSTLNAFSQYVELVKKASFYDMGVTPQWGEQLLTLSTCSYHTNNGTFVVVARRIK